MNKNKEADQNNNSVKQKKELNIINPGMLKFYGLAAVLVFTIVISILQKQFNIPNSIAKIILLIFIILTAIFYVYMKNKWMRAYMMAIDSLQPILTYQKNPPLYRQELMSLLQFQKAVPFQMMLQMGLYASYCMEENWEQAKNELLDAPFKKSFGLQKVAYWVDRAYVDFRLNNDEEAFDIIKGHRDEFIRCQDLDRIGGLIRALFIIETIKQGDKDKGRTMFNEMKDSFHQKALEEEFAYINTLLS